MAKINFSLGYTINTGDYESVRVGLGVEDDKRDGETVDQAYQRIRDWVDKTLGKEVEDIHRELGRVTGKR